MPVKDGIEAAFEIREYEQAKALDRCRIVSGSTSRSLLGVSQAWFDLDLP